MSAHPVPSGESETLEERLRQDAADVERITDTHTAMVVRPVLVKRLREAADELTRLRAEAARYREALEEIAHTARGDYTGPNIARRTILIAEGGVRAND